MFTLDTNVLLASAGQVLWPLFRIMGFFMVAPIFGAQMVPKRVRMTLSVAMTVVVVPVLPKLPIIDGISLQAMMIIAQQVLIGIAMGFMLQVFYQIFVITGQIIAMKMGLGFASMVDPSNGVTVAVMSQAYIVLVNLVFVVSNGHLVMIEMLAQSFQIIPVGFGGVSREALTLILQSGSWMFAASLLLALPAITALMIVNIAFGIMSRASPQLNIFSLGFPVTLIVGLVLFWVSLTGFLSQYQRYVTEIFAQLTHLQQVWN